VVFVLMHSLSTQGQTISLVYVDATKGWINVQTDSTVKGAYNVRYTVIAGGGGGGVATLGRYGGWRRWCRWIENHNL
jgi:hypothetical protein